MSQPFPPITFQERAAIRAACIVLEPQLARHCDYLRRRVETGDDSWETAALLASDTTRLKNAQRFLNPEATQ